MNDIDIKLRRMHDQFSAAQKESYDKMCQANELAVQHNKIYAELRLEFQTASNLYWEIKDKMDALKIKPIEIKVVHVNKSLLRKSSASKTFILRVAHSA